jgi:hypothetical protein
LHPERAHPIQVFKVSAANGIADLFAAADLDATRQNPLVRESVGENQWDSMQHGLEAFS